jgi:hypothetical protein
MAITYVYENLLQLGAKSCEDLGHPGTESYEISDNALARTPLTDTWRKPICRRQAVAVEYPIM